MHILRPLRPRLPPLGYTYYHDGSIALAALSRDLCRIAAFFTEVEPYVRLVRVRDWWQHDGLFFVEEQRFDLHHVFHMVGTPREMSIARRKFSSINGPRTNPSSNGAGWHFRTAQVKPITPKIAAR